MGWLVQPLLFFLARCSRNQLIRQIEFLKAENEMLRKRVPKKPDEVRELVLKIARETGWGYTRILGELRKLGINDICRQTVVNIFKQAGN